VVDLREVTVIRSGREILSKVNWTLPAGACAGILGPNGSGKSTLVRVIMGQIWPSIGSVSVLGQTFGETDLNELRESIRLVQTSSIVEFDPEDSALQVVLTGFFGTVGLFKPVTPAMERRAMALIRKVGLSTEARQPFRTLSSGERIRCLIARALVIKPKLLILDEPTAGLDLLAREQVLGIAQKLLTRTGPALLMITHHIEELLPQTTHVLVLEEGTVAGAGSPGEVLKSPLLSRVYHCPVHISRHDGRYWWRVKTENGF
jgi:iron complex transport system ATP-binding protein